MTRKSGHSSLRASALVLLVCIFVPACSNDSPTEPKPAAPSATHSMIVVDTPARAAMIQEGTLADVSVTLSGSAQDTISTITSLSINGVPVAVSGFDHKVDFSVQQQSRWGLSIVTGHATNSGGGSGELAHSYLRSPGYFPPTAAANAVARVPDAFVTRLRQAVLDDGNRSDANDLATALNLYLSAQDWNANIPSCFVNTQAGSNCVAETGDLDCNALGYAIRRGGDVTVGSVVVDYIQLTGGATPRLTERIRITQPRVPVEVSGAARVLCVGTAASVTGSIRADEVTMTFTHGFGVDGQGNLTLASFSVATSWTNARVDVDFGILSFLGPAVNDIASAGLNQFETLFAGAVDIAVQYLLPRLFTNLSLPTSVPLPIPNGGALQIRSVFSSASVGADYVSLGLATQFYPTAPTKNLGAAAHGALRKDGASPTFPGTGYSFGAGVKDDALNQFLWAAWAGGAFDFGAMPNGPCFTSAVGTVASIEAMLPPVVMPGTGTHEVDVGLGDLRVVVDLAPGFATGAPARPGAGGASAAAQATLRVSYIQGASLELDPSTNELHFTLDPSPEIAVQVESAGGAVDPAAWRDLVADAVRCEYTARFAPILNAFPVPEIDFSNVPGATPGAKLGLANGTIERVGDYSVMTGDVEQK